VRLYRPNAARVVALDVIIDFFEYHAVQTLPVMRVTLKTVR
jgi:hypothetical protein